MVRVHACCCGCTVRSGVITFSVLQSLYTLLGIYSCIANIKGVKLYPWVKETPELAEMLILLNNKPLWISFLVVNIINFFVSCFAFYAGVKKLAGMLYMWIITKGIEIIINLAGLIVVIIQFYGGPLHWVSILLIVVIFASSGLNLYCMLLTHSLRVTILEDNAARHKRDLSIHRKV